MKSSFTSIATLFLWTSFVPAIVCAAPTAAPDQSASKQALDARVQVLLAKARHSLRFLKGGTFEMGDWGTESGQHYDSSAGPLHRVMLDSFSMMAYKVTYDDFDIFTDATGKERIDMDEFSLPNRAPRRPAGVSWYGAKAYCQWLGKLTQLPFDLPTEAQWEYAARSGGKKVLFATDNGKIERPRNFPKEWKEEPTEPPLPDVGSYPPNPAGLYGMSENTHEWVQDWFDEKYYEKSPEKNPKGPASGTEKVIRGSVGGTAEIAAMVFMRTKDVPQTLQHTFTNGITAKVVMIPFPGYSGYDVSNFRCVVDSSSKSH